MTLVHIAVALIAINFVIYIHELGHYLVARWLGMHVAVFSVGFGPPIYKRMAGDTLFMIAWIPIGGYVKFLGSTGDDGLDKEHLEDLEPDGRTGRRRRFSDRRGWFSSSPRWERILVLLAGPFFNFILSTGLIYLDGVVDSGPNVPQHAAALVTHPESEDSPVEFAKIVLRADDQLFPSVEDLTKKYSSNDWISVSVVSGVLTTDQGLIVSRSDPLEYPLSPKLLASGKATLSDPKASKPGSMGVHSLKMYPIPDDQRAILSRQAGEALYKHTSSGAWLAKPHDVRKKSGGIISILLDGTVAARRGWDPLLSWIAFISIIIGVSNLLPIPPLDGGRVLMELFKKAKPIKAKVLPAEAKKDDLPRGIKSKASSFKPSTGLIVQALIILPGILYLLYLMAQALWFDVYRLMVEIGIT